MGVELHLDERGRKVEIATRFQLVIVTMIGLIILGIASIIFIFGIGVTMIIPTYRVFLVDSVSKVFESLLKIITEISGPTISMSINERALGSYIALVLFSIMILNILIKNVKIFSDIVSLAWVPVKACKFIALRYVQIIAIYNILYILYVIIRDVGREAPVNVEWIIYSLITVMLSIAFYLVINFVSGSILGQNIPQVLVDVFISLPQRGTMKVQDCIDGMLELEEDRSVLVRVTGEESSLVIVNVEPSRRWKVTSKREGYKFLFACEPKNRITRSNLSVKYVKGESEILLRSYNVNAEGPKKIPLNLIIKADSKEIITTNIDAPIYMTITDIIDEMLKGMKINNRDISSFEISYVLLVSANEILEKDVALRYLELEEGEIIELCFVDHS